MKRFGTAFAAITTAVMLFSGCGDVSKAVMCLGANNEYSTGEVVAAMKAVKSDFRRKFDGCKMESLFYSDEYCDSRRKNSVFLDDVSDEKDLIYISVNFRTDGIQRGNGLEPDSLYLWDWALIRDGGDGSWEVKDWGEG